MTADLVVHAWDLARATDGDTELDGELVTAALVFGERLPEDGVPGLFDPPLDVLAGRSAAGAAAGPLRPPAAERLRPSRRWRVSDAGLDVDEAVFDVVERIPPGRVSTYGAIGRLIGIGPRRVARALSVAAAARCPGTGWCGPTGRPPSRCGSSSWPCSPPRVCRCAAAGSTCPPSAGRTERRPSRRRCYRLVSRRLVGPWRHLASSFPPNLST